MLLAAPRLLVFVLALALGLRARGEGGPPAASSSTSASSSSSRPRPESAEGSARRRPESGSAAAGAAPAGPARVWFQARAFQHVLVWTPGGGPSVAAAAAGGLLYDVQYKRYGSPSWTPVPRCSAIAGHCCDLSDETREPRRRYYARVRAVAGGAASPWTRTAASFSPEQATLNMSLSLSGNKIQVTSELPLHRRKNATIANENPHPWVQYQAYVRRTSDNFQYMLVNNSLAFDLPDLLWDEQYCVHVEAHLLSWPNPTKRTEEQCISTPPLKDHAEATVTLSLAFLSLAAFGAGVMVWVRTYVRKPMETPSVLKSSWVLWKPAPPGLRGVGLCLAVEPIHPISVGLKDHPPSDSTNKMGGADWLVPEKTTGHLPGALASGEAGGPRLGGLLDSSGCSTDSGICLRDPLGSLSPLLPPGPLGCRRLSLGGSAEGSVLATPSSCRSEPASAPHAQVSGDQRQLGGSVELAGFSRSSPSLDGLAQAKPASASGYVKQAPGPVPSATGPSAVPPESGLGPFLGSTRQRELHHPSSMASGALPFLPDFPKSLLASGLFEQEPAWPPPHLSLLHSGVQLSLSPPWCRV